MVRTCIIILCLICATASAKSTRGEKALEENMASRRGRQAVMDALEHTDNEVRVFALIDRWKARRLSEERAAEYVKLTEKRKWAERGGGAGVVVAVVGAVKLALIGVKAFRNGKVDT